MHDIIKLNLMQFSLVYLLLIIVLAIMKKCHINQTRLLITASIRMTIQLVIAGLILTYIFKNPHPIFTILYLIFMIGFAIYLVLIKNKELNKKFKFIIAVSLAGSGLIIIIFFISTIIGVHILNPQYTIPISGMVIGNAMTGITLGLKVFKENIENQRSKIESLINMAVTPEKILIPFVSNALETALLPTINSMLGMGIISLPGMMTGQILSGTLPMTAIFYQIAILIAISTVVCLSVFCSLFFGYKTLFNKRKQMLI